MRLRETACHAARPNESPTRRSTSRDFTPVAHKPPRLYYRSDHTHGSPTNGPSQRRSLPEVSCLSTANENFPAPAYARKPRQAALLTAGNTPQEPEYCSSCSLYSRRPLRRPGLRHPERSEGSGAGPKAQLCHTTPKQLGQLQVLQANPPGVWTQPPRVEVPLPSRGAPPAHTANKPISNPDSRGKQETLRILMSRPPSGYSNADKNESRS